MSNKTVDLNLTIKEYLDKLNKETIDGHYSKIIIEHTPQGKKQYFNVIHSFLYFVNGESISDCKSINSKKFPGIVNSENKWSGNSDGSLSDVNKFISGNHEKAYSAVKKELDPQKNTLSDFFNVFWKHIIYKTSDKGKNYKKTMKDYIKDVFGINMDDRLMKNKLKKLIDNGTKQIILHGAPGTGKTFTAEKIAEEYVADYFSKEEYVADYFSKNENIDVKDLYEKLKNNSDLKENFEKYKDKYIKKVQFHPSFDYTDFVEGLRPAIIEKDNTDNSTTKTDKSPTFVRMDGILKKFCREIESNKDSDKLYFLLIDEINRADLSKVLGDLMYLMNDPQRSKKDKDEKKKIETPYSNMPTYIVDDNGNGKFLDNQNDNDKKDIFHDGFFLPDNLIIIGTMNDIDRSVDAFDFALRRRFVWIEADANTEAEDAIPNIITDTSITGTLIDRLKKLNEVISGKEGQKLGLSEKYHIGHAYAKNFDGSYDTLWENSIKPVLDDYCLGKKDNGFIKACENALKGKSQPDNQASSGN